MIYVSKIWTLQRPMQRETFVGNFVSKLNCHTPMNTIWNMIQRIKGKNRKKGI